MASVWSASQGQQGDTGNKLAFLTLAQVSFPTFTPPSPHCPSSAHFQGQLDERLLFSDERIM